MNIINKLEMLKQIRKITVNRDKVINLIPQLCETCRNKFQNTMKKQMSLKAEDAIQNMKLTLDNFCPDCKSKTVELFS